MGTKQSLYDANILNTLNPDINVTQERVQNISNKINININDNISNLYKRDTLRSKHISQIGTDPNTKNKKSKRKKQMTRQQRILLKKLLNENALENKKKIAKNLIGFYLGSKKNNNINIKRKEKKKHSETPKSKFIKKEIKKEKPKFRKYASVVNITTKFSKLSKKKIDKDNKSLKHHNINDTKDDDLPDNTKMEKLNINDDTYENENDNDENDDNDNENDFGILNFTSLAKMSIAINDSFTNNNQKEANEENIEDNNSNNDNNNIINDINNKGLVLQRKSFRDYVENNTKRDYNECLKFINSTFVLSHLEESDKSLIIQSLKIKNFKKDICILKLDSKINKMYFIKEGLLRCLDEEGTCIRTLTVGDNFGEKEILMHQNINLNKISLITVTDCICYSISIKSFKKMFGNKFRNFLFFNFMKAAFDCSKFLENLNDFYIKKIFKFFSVVNLDKDNVAFPIGHIKSSKFVIIVSGDLINSKNGEIIGRPLDILYEEELMNLSNEKIKYALDPAPESETLFLEGDTKDILNYFKCKNFEEVLNKNIILKNLSKIILFKSFSQLKLYKLLDLIHIETYERDSVIIKEGTIGEKFYIVKNGQVEVFQKNLYLRTLNSMEYFGERALLTNEVRSATVIAKDSVELYSLDKESFKKNLSQMMVDYLNISLYLHDESVSLEDLIFIKELGKGNYGSVSLVMNKRTKFPYAIKAINKIRINKEKMKKHIQLEKNILLKIDHPFIVKLVKCLENDKNIFFLMEYIKGKELFDIIRDIGLLNKEQTNFYTASMLIAINYLHTRKIIYRDIKPENIIVERNGYIKLVDFGTAKEIEDRTKTVIGTPHYMAPETIMGGGYSFQVDFWSISICMYEFMCGEVPFGDKAEDPMEIYFAIINNNLEFPGEIIKDKEFKHLMRKLLDKNPAYRLTNFFSIKGQPWFKDFNWDELSNLNLKAPYLPNIPYTHNDFDEQYKPLFDNEKEKFKNYIDYIETNSKEYEVNATPKFSSNKS